MERFPATWAGTKEEDSHRDNNEVPTPREFFGLIAKFVDAYDEARSMGESRAKAVAKARAIERQKEERAAKQRSKLQRMAVYPAVLRSLKLPTSRGQSNGASSVRAGLHGRSSKRWRCSTVGGNTGNTEDIFNRADVIGKIEMEQMVKVPIKVLRGHMQLQIEIFPS